ncbi:MAG: glycerol-3-phosphate dehydrogenase/oxidase [Arenicellales bacterium]
MAGVYEPMKRDLDALSSTSYDVVVIGGGIFGICAAWDAVLRGFKVALIERGDFAGAASANCYKMVHGGIRYLQHGDLVRLRESARERSILLRIAPHLVTPLPIVVPTFGHGRNGKEILRAATLAYDALTLDRNRGIHDPSRRIPAARKLSRSELLEHFDGFDDPGLTGGVLFHDAQMYSPPRLAMAFLRAACAAGLDAANYVEAAGLERAGGSVKAVKARDKLSGAELVIRGRAFINAAGPWAERLLSRSLPTPLTPASTFSRDAYFIVRRRLDSPYTLAVQARNRDPDALLSRQARHLFIVPWREYSIIGVWHVVYRGDPDAVTVSREDLARFIDEINGAYPPLDLSLEDVTQWNAGLVLFGDRQADARNLSYGKRSRLVDHQTTHGIDNLVSLIGIRYTMARSDAKRAVDMVVAKLGTGRVASKTHITDVYGSGFGRFEDLLADIQARWPALPLPTRDALARNHGIASERVLAAGNPAGSAARLLAGSHVVEEEVIYAAREEMAVKLSDVVFRRTDLGTGGHPGRAAIERSAQVLGRELGWSGERIRREVEEVESLFRHLGSVAAMEQAASA